MSRTPVDLRPSHSAHNGWMRLRSAAYGLTLMICVYLCSVYIPPGWVTYLSALAPLTVIMITVVARNNDMSTDCVSARWRVRRTGLWLTALFALRVAAEPPLFGAPGPSWTVVFGAWGFALVWLTTPHQPPWPKFVWMPLTKRAEGCPHRRADDDFDANP